VILILPSTLVLIGGPMPEFLGGLFFGICIGVYCYHKWLEDEEYVEEDDEDWNYK